MKAFHRELIPQTSSGSAQEAQSEVAWEGRGMHTKALAVESQGQRWTLELEQGRGQGKWRQGDLLDVLVEGIIKLCVGC